MKDGRYWIGSTTWSDTRKSSIINILETRRVTQKQIVSFLNDAPIHVHNTESASKESISKCHKNIQLHVFKRIFESFDENSAKPLEEIIKEIK